MIVLVYLQISRNYTAFQIASEERKTFRSENRQCHSVMLALLYLYCILFCLSCYGDV